MEKLIRWLIKMFLKSHHLAKNPYRTPKALKEAMRRNEDKIKKLREMLKEEEAKDAKGVSSGKEPEGEKKEWGR